MNTTTALADLDELILLCRDDKARLYIDEAVSCYRSGAFRSAIVAAWIAVCYDIIDKLRELALAGDKEAEAQVKGIEETQAANDIARALKFERGILDLARDKFALISHLEHIDLDRLQEDRNRCAHPSLISEDQGFNPSGELARLHIRSAVLHLLQHQPVQGKYAVERLLREVNSEYFPTNVSKALASLSHGPLKRPRESLVRNFVIVLAKRALSNSTEWKARMQAVAALGAVEKLHHSVFYATLQDKLPSLYRALPDEDLIFGAQLIARFGDAWELLPPDVQSKLEEYTFHLPSGHLSDIDDLLKCKPLAEKAKKRVGRATKKELQDVYWLFGELPLPIGDRIVDLYSDSKSFHEANEWSPMIISNASDFTPDQQRRILASIAKNDELTESCSASTVISKLRQTKRLPELEFERLLEENGLQTFMAAPPQPSIPQTADDIPF